MNSSPEDYLKQRIEWAKEARSAKGNSVKSERQTHSSVHSSPFIFMLRMI